MYDTLISHAMSSHVRVRDRSEPLASERHDVQSWGQLIEEMRMARLNLPLECGLTILEQLAELEASVGQLKIENLLQLFGHFEVEDLRTPVVLLVDIVEQHIDQFQEEGTRLLFGLCIIGVNVWNVCSRQRCWLNKRLQITIKHASLN